MRWRHIEGIDWANPETDASGAVWRVPAGEMKLEFDLREQDVYDHPVPLAAEAVEVLRVQKRLSGRSSYVFPSMRTEKEPMSNMTLGEFYNRQGYKGRHCPPRLAQQLLNDHERPTNRPMIALARARSSQSALDGIDCALQVIDERALRQITDHLFEAPSGYLTSRTILGMRERHTRKRRDRMTGLNLMGSMETPRSEQLWHSLRHKWCSPRLQQGGNWAWILWRMQGRPPIARGGTS